MKWEYGKSYERFPMNDGRTWESTDGKIQLAVHDLRNGLHPIHNGADCVFVDPPWNLGNVNTFITKADLKSYERDFEQFMKTLFSVIDKISPQVLYVEMGKQNLALVKRMMEQRFKRVEVFNSYYYHAKKNVCFILRGSNRDDIAPNIDGIDEEDAIAEICRAEKFDKICDPCMGRGLVAYYAVKNGRKCSGTELNHKRLSFAVERIVKFGIEMNKIL